MTVTGCDDCPLEYDSMACRHPEAPKGDHELWRWKDAGGAPGWCPLRTAPLTIALEQEPQRE